MQTPRAGDGSGSTGSTALARPVQKGSECPREVPRAGLIQPLHLEAPAGAEGCNMNHGKQGMWPQTGNTVLFISTLREAALRIGWSFRLNYFKPTRAAPYFLCLGNG